MIEEVLRNEQAVDNPNCSESGWVDDGKRYGGVDDLEQFEIMGRCRSNTGARGKVLAALAKSATRASTKNTTV